MAWVAASIIGGSLLSGYLGGKASEAQAGASQYATDVATGEQARQFDIQQENLAPYLESGVNALGLLSGELGMEDPNIRARRSELDSQIAGLESKTSYDSDARGMAGAGQAAGVLARVKSPEDIASEREELVRLKAERASLGEAGQQRGYQPEPIAEEFEFNLEADPGYQFARDEAIRATNREMAGAGKYGSGNRLAAIADRVTGMASQYAGQAFGRQAGEYGVNYARGGDIYGRRQDYLNRLSGLTGTGQTATAQSGAAGANMASAIGNIQMANAAQQGSAAANKYGSYNQAIQGGVSNMMLYNQLKQPPLPKQTWT